MKILNLKKEWRPALLNMRLFNSILLAQLLFLIIIGIEIIGTQIATLRVLVTVLYLFFMPGVALAFLLRLDKGRKLDFVLYTIGLSFSFIMAIGVFMSLLYPYIGIQEPITLLPLIVTFFIVVPVVTLGADYYRNKIFLSKSMQIRNFIAPTPLFLLNLPLMSIITITILNRSGSTLPLFLFLILISAIPALVLFDKIDPRWYPLALILVPLSVLYHISFWENSYPIESWMPAVTAKLGYWQPVIGTGVEQEGLLPQSLLIPIFSIFGGITPLTQLRVVNPLMVSIIPLTVFLIYRRYVLQRYAFLGAILVTFTHSYFTGPFGSRDMVATMFLTIFVLAAFDKQIDRTSRAILSIIFLACTIISHYGVAFILIGAIVGVATTRSLISHTSIIPTKSSSRFTFALSIFTLILTLSWYEYTSGQKGGWFVSNLMRFFQDPLAVQPHTTAYALQVQSPFSLQVMKGLYFLLTALMGIGILKELIRRFQDKSITVDTEYLLLGISFLGVLAATFLPLAAYFETERIIRTVYPITGIFAILGLQWLEEGTPMVRSALPETPISVSDSLFNSEIVFIGILMVFFLFGSGVVADLSTEDYSTSLVLSDEDLRTSEDPRLQWAATDCFKCDGQSVAWLADHYTEGYTSISDQNHNWPRFYGLTLVTETSVPAWEILSEDFPLRRSNEDHLFNYQSENRDEAYIRLHSKNHRTDHILRDSSRIATGELEPMESIDEELEQSHKIYSNENSTVYHA